jgi:O-antigen/teichoic acid export membrane protein
MPSFCKEQEDTTQLQSWYLKILQYCSFIVLPISLWLCFNMTELVIVVFGNSWISAIPMIQILSIAFPFTILDASAYTVYISLGKNFLFLKIVTIRLFATIITLIITTPKGLLVVCIWQSIIYAVFAILDNFIISKILAISWNKIKNTLTSSLLSALVFACLLVVIKNITQSIIPLTAILSLCLTLLISLTMWCGTIYILNRDTIFTIVNLIRIFITTKHKTIKTP